MRGGGGGGGGDIARLQANINIASNLWSWVLKDGMATTLLTNLHQQIIVMHSHIALTMQVKF